MRGIERLVAGGLLVMAVTGTAVLARTSAPGGGHAQALRLQSPPRSHAVAPLPVVVAGVPPQRVVVHQPTHQAPPALVSVSLETPIAASTPPVPPSEPSPRAAPTPTPAPTPASPPASTTRVVAAAPPKPTTTHTKTFGHSHPRGHAWGHVKHALTTLSVADETPEPAADPPAPAAPPAPSDPQPQSDPGTGNGNGHAYGHSKHASGD